MSSFFTLPASQRKRKSANLANAPSKRRSLAPRGALDRAAARDGRQRPDDEDISGSESGGEADDGTDEDAHITSEEENETAAEKRLRLAERYLDNLREELDPAGFDAADVDRELIAARLREDVAESKGVVYRHIASQLDYTKSQVTTFRADQRCPTGVALSPPYAFTVAKDLTVCKWLLPDNGAGVQGTNVTPRRKPKLVKRFSGHRSQSKNAKYMGHVGPILCIAVSSSGKFLATGGADKRVVIWDAATLKPLRAFLQHRDKVLSVSFRRNTHTLYSASADRTIKIFSLDEMTYVETLFGHQDHVYDIVGLAQESCISVGSRDRTARLWKVVEESQLVFRGGGSGKDIPADCSAHVEGSIERVAMIDESTFVTGSDNGSLSLWSVQRKKPLHTLALAHGTDPFPPPMQISAEIEPPPSVSGHPQARWITALKTIPYSDLILSGSWDGHVRAWRVSSDKRRLESVGSVFETAVVLTNGHENLDGEPAVQDSGPLRGIVNDISVVELGERGKDGICIIAAVAKEHRLGEWKKLSKARNEGVIITIPKSITANLNGHVNGHVE